MPRIYYTKVKYSVSETMKCQQSNDLWNIHFLTPRFYKLIDINEIVMVMQSTQLQKQQN